MVKTWYFFFKKKVKLMIDVQEQVICTNSIKHNIDKMAALSLCRPCVKSFETLRYIVSGYSK